MKKLSIAVALLMCGVVATSAQTKLAGMEQYRRSSLNLIMVEDPRIDTAVVDIVRRAFLAAPIPDKYNDHGVDASLRYVKASDVVVDNYAESKMVLNLKKKGDADKGAKTGAAVTGLLGALAGVEMGPSNQKYNIQKMTVDTTKRWMPHVAYHHLKKHDMAKKAIDKWFGVESGNINIDLVRERAFFNATDQEIKAATESGDRPAEDAIMDNGGHEIISNTFVAISTTRLLNAQQMADEIIYKAALVANFLPRNEADLTMSTAELAAAATAAGMGDGNAVYTTTYLFRLVWNEEIFNKINAVSGDVAKYNALDCFHLEYVGDESTHVNVRAKDKSGEEKVKLTYEEAVAKAMVEAQRVVLAKLEKKYEVFRTKTPLTEIDPVMKANIGTKECVEEKDKYEILQKIVKLDKKSGKQTVSYKRAGVITVDKVGDNLTDPSAQTTFTGKLPKGVFKGSLIRFTK
ncbi:MAG: hypothetical protein E7147_01660 [Rikenellaceae bacterium]|nr:hypothetical protein [Rikenellaceae bacterium]